MFLEKDDPLLSKVSHPAWDPQKKLPFWRDKEKTILTFRRWSCQGLGCLSTAGGEASCFIRLKCCSL